MSRWFWARLSRRAPARAQQAQRAGRPDKKRRHPVVETLESRDLLSGFHPDYVLLPEGAGGAGAAPFSSPGPTGTTPAQIRHAYGFDQITFNNGTVAGDGSGETIAIVDAYDDPNIANDVHQFDLKFGLPDPTFTKVNQSGGSTPPAANGGWASEIALDVEWSHAIAPKANILLVEASSSTYTNLFAAVTYAAKQPGVVAVSMSWGGGEFSGESSYDTTFQTPAGHGGVTFVASSGDSGAPPSYPAASPNVLAVGGTTLNLDSSGNILGESGWSGSGGGISSAESQPAYQNGVVTQTTTARANPDVSYDADPNTGFPVYDSYNNGSSSPWSQFGGTSDAAPQWAALIAIADQGRALAGLGALDGPSQTLPALYSLPAGDFHDVTSGSSTGSPGSSAGPGYDLVTGRGTPAANLIVAGLAGQSSPAPGATHIVVSVPTSSTAGAAFTATVTVEDANGNPVTTYTGTVHFTSSDSQAVLPANYTFTGTDSGSHSFSVTLKTAGSQTVTGTDTSNASITGAATVTVSPATATRLVFGQQPSNATPGTVITPAVTVRLLDTYGNLVSNDNADQVAVAIGINPAGGTLSGTTTVTVRGGIATFSNLSINTVGNGYTLAASLSPLTVTSGSFNIVSATTNVIEGFETSDSWYIVGGWYATAYRSTAAAHDGTYGLDDYGGNDWIYRNVAATQLKAGDTASVWLQFSGSADGRAYLGFGASSAGTLSLVAAPNTGQLILQQNLGYGFADLAAVNQGYVANHWYRLEVDWGTSGTIIGKLFDSNGTSLLQSVTASTTAITSGGIAFRATGNDKFWDTVTATHGVNNFAIQTAGHAGSAGGFFGADLTGSRLSALEASLALRQIISGWPTLNTGGLTAGLVAPRASLSAPVGAQPVVPGHALVDHYFASDAGADTHAHSTTAPSTSPLPEANVLAQLFWTFAGIR